MNKVLHLGFKIIQRGSRTCLKLVKNYIIKTEKCKWDNVNAYNDLEFIGSIKHINNL